MEFDRARRRALLKLAAGIGLSTALGRALAQTSAKQGVRTVQGDMRINGKPAEAGTVVRPREAIALGDGALAPLVVGHDPLLPRGKSRAVLIGSGLLVTALQPGTGNRLA